MIDAETLNETEIEVDSDVEEDETDTATEKAQKKARPVMTEEALFQSMRILETVLFTAQDLLTENDLKPFFTEDIDIKLVLEHLQQQYENRGINLVQRGKGWGFRTAPDLAEKLTVHKVEVKPMSRAAVETLSIVAYHQPVTRAEVEQIRGVTISKSTFEILVAENLIKPGKRRDVPGRPLTWITTQHFLDTFGLESIKQLPNLQELKDAGLLSAMPPQLEGQLQHSLPLVTDEDTDIEETTESDEEFEAAFDEDGDDTTEQGESA